MINGSLGHKLIAISNKLFAVCCGATYNVCEVYDSTCKKFVVFKSPLEFFDGSHQTSVSIGRRIMVFRAYSTKVATYDVDKNEWSEEPFENTENIRDFYCLKLPSLNF